MTETTKQVLAGLGAVGGLAVASVVGAPLWLVIAVGAGFLGAGQLLLTAANPPSEIRYPEGVTEEDLQKVVAQIQERQQLFREVAASVKPAFRSAILEMCGVLDEIIRVFRNDPKDIRHPDVASLQPILDMLRNSLRGYMELAQRQSLTKDEEQSLDRIEKVMQLTTPALRRLLSSMTNDDRRSMDADAMTLEALLAGAANEFKESEVANTRHKVTGTAPGDSSSPQGKNGAG